jgi:hypothetical protein
VIGGALFGSAPSRMGSIGHFQPVPTNCLSPSLQTVPENPEIAAPNESSVPPWPSLLSTATTPAAVVNPPMPPMSSTTPRAPAGECRQCARRALRSR